MLQEVPVYLRTVAAGAVQALLSSASFNAYSRALFEKVNTSGREHIATVTFQLAGLDALAVLEWLQRKEDFQFFWERPDDSFGISAGGTLLRFETAEQTRFEEADRWFTYWKTHNRIFSEHVREVDGLFALGGFSFDANRSDALWSDFPQARLVIPKWVYIREGDRGTLCINRLVHPGDQPEDLYSFFSERAETFTQRLNQPVKSVFHPEREVHITGFSEVDHLSWRDRVEEALETIKSGGLEKVVLARKVELHSDFPFESLPAVNWLRERFPGAATFLISFNGGGTLAGCSPEKLVSVSSNLLQTEAVAGSIARGRSAGEDAMNEQKLLQSQKDVREHRFVLEELAERLLPISSLLEYPEFPRVRKLANVQHLVSPVKAELKDHFSAVSVAGLLHPTPAMGGSPREAAMAFLQSRESFNRGWYASPVGWLSSYGRAEFTVAIRCALLRECSATLFAGCGIVAGSDPQQEWEETRIKFQPMMEALRHDRR